MRSVAAQMFWSLYGRLAWDANTPLARAEQIEAVVREIILSSTSRGDTHVLDAGCGTGDYSLACARAGLRVTAIDSAPGMLAQARRKLEPHPLTSVEKADVSHPLPFPDASFDCVLAISVLHLTTDPGAALDEFKRVLKLGGKLVLLHATTPRNASALAITRQKTADTRRRFLPFGLLWLKTSAEQRCRSVSWSRTELCHLLGSHGFTIQKLSEQSPFLAFADRL